DVAAEVSLLGVLRRLDLDVAREKPDLAALVDLERDLAEVHPLERTIERDPVAADRRDPANLGLAGVVVGRREHDLVADAPARSIENLDLRGAFLGRRGEFRPRVRPIAMQIQGAA